MTKEEVYNVVKTYIEESNGNHKLKDFINKTGISSWQLQKYGGYLRIVQDLGYPNPTAISQKDFYKKVEDYIKNVSYVPTQLEFSDKGICYNSTFDRFGGYKKVLSDLGYEYPKWRAKDYTKEEMKIAFLKIYDKAPSLHQVEEDYRNGNLPFSTFVIRTKFDTLNALVKYCGLEFNERILYYYTDEEIIKMFLDKYGSDSPPLAEQVNKDYHNGEIDFSANMIQRHYNDYTTFLLMCGYDNIEGTFGIKCEAKDGHICDSKAEKLIDDFLYENNLPHQVHIKYKNIINGFEKNNKMDFLLNDNIVVEYFGLMGNKQYEKKVKEKLKILNENKIKYISIYPKDLQNLEVIFMPYLDKGGIKCSETN